MKSIMPFVFSRTKDPIIRTTDLFDTVWGVPFKGLDLVLKKTPAVDISEDKEAVKIKAELPGMTEKDIDLTYDNEIVTIKGEKREEHEEAKKDSYYSECSYGSFERNIAVGGNVDWEKSTANYKNGVLNVTIPRKEEAKPKKIEVTT